MEIPESVKGIRLAKIVGDRLVLCEAVMLEKGAAGVDTVLRRGALSGRVEVAGDVGDHFADLLDEEFDIVETVALDADSYRKLKNYWLRCKIDRTQA